MKLALRFLGVGSAQAPELGSACAVLERAGEPLLMIDCGPEALQAYLQRYGAPPRAVYVTHTHMDHVGGLERLFYKVYFDPDLRGRVRLFAHAALVPLLQSRTADYPEVLAEGGANFWDAFALVPCSRGFWCDGLWFDVFGTRHHAPGTYAEYVKLASIEETPGQPAAEDMVRLLCEGNEAVVRTARKVFPSVDAAHDEPTADLLTQRMQVHEKNAWMLRSLLEA